MAIYFLRWARHQSRNAINPTKPRLRFGISQSNSAMALPSRFLTRCFDTGELSQWLRFTTARVPTGSLQTRHLAPQPKTTSATPLQPGLDGLIEGLIAAQHVMEMFRRSLPNGHAGNRLLRLSKRLFKILAEIRKLRTT
jgi:hypothetical protein